MEENTLPKIVVKPRLRGIDHLFRDTFLVFRRHWAPLAVVQAIVFLASVILTIIAVVIFMMPLVVSLTQGGGGKDFWNIFFGVYFWVGLAAIILPITVVISWGVAAQIATIGYKGEGMAPIGWSLKEGFRFFFPTFLLILLTSAANVGAFVLFFFPALILMTGLLFVLYIRIYENVSIWQAIGTSWYITKGYKWSIFGRLLLLVLSIWAVSFGFAIIGVFPFMGIMTLPFQIILNLVVTPAVMVYCYLIYQDIRFARRETYSFRGGIALFVIICWTVAIAFMSGAGFLATYLLQKYAV